MVDVEKNSNSERISVHLKTLVDLARMATGLNLSHQRIRAGQNGAYLSRFKGRGMEFDETRLYQPGDDIRSIDWRVTARTGKTHTKVFREEREKPVFISVDFRPPMVFATRGVFKSVQAARLAALLAWAALRQGDRIGGQIFSGEGCLELKPQHSKSAILQFLNALVSPAMITPVTMTLNLALQRLIQHVRPGNQVFIISDFRGLNEVTENHLLKISRHADVTLIHVFDPLESHLPSRGQYRFTDDQRDVVIDCSDKPRISRYQQRFLHQQQHLQRLSQQLHITLLQCSTTDDPLAILR